ncbi:cytochrome C oxidase subunit IV family protein [Candidatus Palauibacter sp.]|uniref:cytochrome C oxidase subunit IV family protein n=1 Tax=Candidatus Palauibacter sp. TaxID=3101350 RepID=UPI003B02076C
MSDHSGASHPGTRFYVAVAVILAALTALEVMVFYIEALAPVLVPILLAMMAAKFALVAMFFMHLRSDGPLLTGVFVWGLFIATAVVVGLMAIFGKFGG